MIITLPDTRAIRNAPHHNFTAATRAVQVSLEHFYMMLQCDMKMGPIPEDHIEKMTARAIDEPLAEHGMNRYTWTREATRRGLSDAWIWKHGLWDLVHPETDTHA